MSYGAIDLGKDILVLDPYSKPKPSFWSNDFYSQFGYFETHFPGKKAYIVSALPGYSGDGNTALFRGHFGPTAHGASVTLILKKLIGGWKVTACELAYYL